MARRLLVWRAVRRGGIEARRGVGVLVVIAVLAAGCTSYRVRQSSLVPAMALPPPPINHGPMDLYLGDSTVTFLSEPERAPSSQAGMWVARHNLELAGTVHASEHFGVRLLGMDALDAGAIRTAPTTVPPPDAITWAIGGGLLASLPLGERHVLHGELDLLLMVVASRVFATCISSCENVPHEQVQDQRKPLVLPAFSVTYGYRLAPNLTLTATLGGREHPTNREVFESDVVSARVSTGPLYITTGIGAEIDLTDWLSVVPRVQWPIMRDPIRYGPIVGLGVRGTLHPIESQTPKPQ